MEIRQLVVHLPHGKHLRLIGRGAVSLSCAELLQWNPWPRRGKAIRLERSAPLVLGGSRNVS